jgi:hypothetical protein
MSLIRILLLLSLLSPLVWSAATDDGRGIDPNGRPATASASACDEGSGLDPHGGCRPGNTLDAGVRIDPEG